MFSDAFSRATGFFILFALSFFSERALQGQIIFDEKPLDIVNDLDQWNSGFKKSVEKSLRAGNFVEPIKIVSVQRQPGIFIAVAYFQKTMNRLLVRSSIFSEGVSGLSEGEMVGNDDSRVKLYELLAKGHNIPGSKLIQFYERLPRHHANSVEKEFRDKILPKITKKMKGDPFILLGYSLQNFNSPKEILGHEIAHALKALNPSYSKNVDAYYEDFLTAQERRKVRRILGKNYDAKNAKVIRDEFQAYLLESDASTDKLACLVPLHRLALIRFLKKRGSPALLIE